MLLHLVRSLHLSLNNLGESKSPRLVVNHPSITIFFKIKNPLLPLGIRKPGQRSAGHGRDAADTRQPQPYLRFYKLRKCVYKITYLFLKKKKKSTS